MTVVNNSAGWCILHPKKTGGTWVERACERAVRGASLLGNVHMNLSATQGRWPTVATFVRRPAPWLESYWLYRMNRGNRAHMGLDIRDIFVEDFDAFLEAYLKDFSGWLYSHFCEYAGPPEDEVFFIGRQETLEVDLARFLRRVGASVDFRRLYATKPANVSDQLKATCNETETFYPEQVERPAWKPRLWQQVNEAERPILDRWYSGRRRAGVSQKAGGN